MKITAAVLLAFMLSVMLLVLAAVGTVKAQVVGSQEECFLFADMALVTSALTKVEMKEPVLRNVLADIYNYTDAHKPLVDGVVRRGYAFKGEPKDFAKAFAAHCVAHRGDVSGFLGASS